MNKSAALFSVIKRLHVILSLAKYRAELKLKLALLSQLFHSSRNAIVIVRSVESAIS